MRIKLQYGVGFLQRRSILLLTFLMVTTHFAVAIHFQDKVVTGKIVGSDNTPIPGVSVYQRGTASGTISDTQGNYKVSVFNTDAVLVFSAIGFLTQEIAVQDRSTINITLRDDTKTLDEVVIVGYGEQKRSDVTGSLTVVKVADIQNKTQFRLDDALQGMASGVNVTKSGGAPGAAPDIHIRGVGSINDTSPLWIVDGIRQDPGFSFDVSDVESMEVLKDAAASAVYGAQAANGVILVKTKRGKGDLKVTFKSSIGQRSQLKLPHFLNSEDYVKYRTEGRLNAGQNPDPSWSDITANTDWLKAYYAGGGAIQSNYVSLSKGDDKFSFFMSVGNDNETGILIDNTYKRYSMRLNADMKVTKWLKFGESMLASRVIENPIGQIDNSYTGGIPYRSIPLMPIYDPTNPYGGWGRAPVFFQGANPVASQYQQHENKTTNRLDGNFFAEITPVKNLLIRSTVGTNFLNIFDQAFNEAFDYGPGDANHLGQLIYSTTNQNAYTANVVATYNKTIAKHTFKVMGGYESWQFDTRHFNVVGNNYPVQVAQSFNLTQGAINTTDRDNVSQDRLVSQFGRFNYSYDERFLLEGNFRRDGSGKLQNNQYGIFPSFSGGWNIAREKFFQEVPIISGLKLRGSRGSLGSTTPVAPYTYATVYTDQFSSYSFDQLGANKVYGWYAARLANANIQWEKAIMTDIAIDLRAFENKCSFSVDYYDKETTHLLYQKPIPPSVGISTNNFDSDAPSINIGTMRNTGFDIDMGYNDNVGKMNLGVVANTSFMRNKMLSLSGGAPIIDGSGGGQIGGMTLTQPGLPVSSFYGYQVQQMLNSASDVYAVNTYAKDGIYQESGTGPGDLMYKDLSGPNGKPDGKITPQYDRKVIGNPWPKMTYALNLTANYNKMIDIMIQFQGVQGVDIFNASKAYNRNFFGDYTTTYQIADAWTPEHHTNNPRNIATDPNGNWGKPSSYFIENGSYLKLRNIQIGFNVPKAILDKLKMTKGRIYVNGNNVLTITKYSGLDPEIAGSNTARGVDYGQYPQVRTFSAGMEIGF
jgi:TonB-linked SusC/RagA family outer membrane protein